MVSAVRTVITGDAAGAGKLGVVGHKDEHGQTQGVEHTADGGEDAGDEDVGGGDGEDVAKEVGGQVGHEAGGEVGEEDADAHAEGPEHGHGGVFTDALPLQGIDAESGEDGEEGGTEQGRKTEVGAQTYAAQRGMGHAAAGNDGAAGDHVGADHGTEQTGRQRSPQGILEEGILKHGLRDDRDEQRNLNAGGPGGVLRGLVDEHEHLVLEGVGQGDATHLKGTDPCGDLVGTHGVEHLAEGFFLVGAVGMALATAVGIEFLVGEVVGLGGGGGGDEEFFLTHLVLSAAAVGTCGAGRRQGFALAAGPAGGDEAGDGGNEAGGQYHEQQGYHARSASLLSMTAPTWRRWSQYSG